MRRNTKKIIRSVTVSNSIDFFKDVMLKMNNNGYETIVVTSPGQFLDKFRNEHSEIHTIEVPMVRHISLIKDCIALCKLIKIFINERPYIVHSMTPKAGFLCMMAAWLTRVPYRIHTFTGLVWPTTVGLKRRILMLTDKVLCGCATHINPEGVGVLNDLKNYGVCKKPMKVIGYGNVMGVDLDRFNPSRFEKHNKDYFSFLFVGRIAKDKGVNELIDAFVKLQQKYPSITLTLIGGNETTLDPISDETETQMYTNSAINYCGTKFDDELLAYYVNADCFVMPSYREGFPNTVLEAGAMGLPQIVTDINGSREIIIDVEMEDDQIRICKNGIIIPPKDSECLFRAMEIMITNSKLRETMSLNAREMIASRFDKNYVQSCQIQFYDEIIN